MSTNGKDRLLDWDLDAPFVPADNKQAQREEIARLTEEFLARGGEITYLPYDPTAEIVDRALNRQLLGFDGATPARTEEYNDTLLDDDDLSDSFFEPYG
jgi:hypothetical protein